MSLKIVKMLKTCRWKWNQKGREVTQNPDDNRIHYGFIAQDLAKIFPPEQYALVQEREGFLSVNYHQIIPHLTKAIQELDMKVKELEEKLNEKE